MRRFTLRPLLAARLKSTCPTSSSRMLLGNALSSFEVGEFQKHCLINGLDDIGLTMQLGDKIDEFEGKMSRDTPWLDGKAFLKRKGKAESLPPRLCQYRRRIRVRKRRNLWSGEWGQHIIDLIWTELSEVCHLPNEIESPWSFLMLVFFFLPWMDIMQCRHETCHLSLVLGSYR